MINEVNFNNKTMRYFKFGSGLKTIIMIPGLSAKSVMESEEIVKNEYKELTSDFTIYCFDRINNPNIGYSIKDMAKDTLDVVDILNLKDLYLLGASQGGMICLSMALIKPELIKKIVVASTTTKVDEKLKNHMNRFISLSKEKKLVELILDFSKLIYPEDFYLKMESFLIDYANSITDVELKNFIIFADAINNFDIFDEIGKINKPVLFVHDKTDNLISIDNFYKVMDKYKNFNYYIYENYGHTLYDLAPDFKGRIKEFYNL